MTKRLSKSLAVLFLSMVMVFEAVRPAFAESSSITYVEDHSVVDCVHRYKNNDSGHSPSQSSFQRAEI